MDNLLEFLKTNVQDKKNKPFLVKMVNAAELVNLLWHAMNFTICQIRPDSGTFRQGPTQDKGIKDKNQFPKCNFVTLPLQ